MTLGSVAGTARAATEPHSLFGQHQRAQHAGAVA